MKISNLPFRLQRNLCRNEVSKRPVLNGLFNLSYFIFVENNVLSLTSKIQLAASTSNWPIESTQSILLLVGLDDLENISDWAHQPLADHLEILSKRAQALEIPVMMIQSSQLQQAMLQLGQHLSSNTQAQVIMAGNLSPLFKQIMQLVLSITDYVAIVNDAILASSLEQHIQWIEK